MIRPSYYTFVPFFVVAAVCAATLTFTAFAQSGCHVLSADHAVPEGFGAAYHLFSGLHEELLRVHCGSNGILVNVGNGARSMLIYHHGYEWRDGAWRTIEFFGAERWNHEWFAGEAHATLERTDEELSNDNFILAYVCVWIPRRAAYACGCRDTACRQSSWQLQIFRDTSQNSSGGPPAADPVGHGNR